MSDFKNRIGTAHSLLGSLERKHDEEMENLRLKTLDKAIEAVKERGKKCRVYHNQFNEGDAVEAIDSLRDSL